MPEPIDRVHTAGGLEEVRWVHRTRRLRALSFDFAVRAPDRALGRHLDRIFSALAVPGEPRHLYSIVSEAHAPDGLPRLYLDGEEVFVGDNFPSVFTHLLWHVNRQVIDRSPSYVLLHASGAEHGGRALIFPAPAESGKTTLVAGLVRAGFRYITDEAVALDPRTGMVHPYPKALSVDPGSWGALANLRPTLEDEVERFSGAQWQVPPGDIRLDAVARPCRPGLVVSPRYASGSGTELVPLSQAEGLVLLVQNSFNFAVHGRVGFYALADLVRHCACFRLAIGDLDEACRIVLDLANGVGGGLLDG